MITVPKHEQGVTRVFALSLLENDAIALRDDPAKQAQAIGAEVATEGVEVFKLSDLGELGLAGYLREGVDARESDIQRDAVKLAALDGWVMLVHSLAFGGQGAGLEPQPTVTLVGTYAQQAADSEPVVIESEAAQPYTGTAAPETPAPVRSGAMGSGLVVVTCILVALLLWWVLA